MIRGTNRVHLVRRVEDGGGFVQVHDGSLLKQAPIVLLDEATSALDPENEENVVAAVDKLRETATILVIAHKLDTIRKADAIVQLRADGTVEDIGTHEELFARGGTYRSFWDHRAAAQGWQL